MSLPLQLRYMGFCGVDDSIDPQLLCDLSKQYTFVEWGKMFHHKQRLIFSLKFSRLMSQVFYFVPIKRANHDMLL